MNKLITVAVIDSGIYPHIDFKNRIVAFRTLSMAEKMLMTTVDMAPM